MKVASTPRSLQPTLFPDVREVTLAASRNYVGDFYEEVTTSFFPGAVRLNTDSRADICPDIHLPLLQSYLEVKSIGCNGAVMAYAARLEKDRDSGLNIFYCLWNHHHRVNPEHNLGELQEALSRKTKSLTIISREALDAILTKGRLMTLNAKATSRGSGQQRRGYGSYGYTVGYRTSLKVVQEQCSLAFLDTPPVTPTAYTYEVRDFEVYIHPTAHQFAADAISCFRPVQAELSVGTSILWNT